MFYLEDKSCLVQEDEGLQTKKAHVNFEGQMESSYTQNRWITEMMRRHGSTTHSALRTTAKLDWHMFVVLIA